MRVYIAGPMTGLPGLNFAAFDEARDRGRAMGHDIVSPADLDREADPHCESKTLAEASTPEKCAEYARRDLDAIFTCDAVAVLPGWARSKGATAEVALCRWLKRPVLDARTFATMAE